mmetsp:Transcript_44143/g.69023  ORF Transcript_44143/g.69023 Transcript_44143/m.69023 type:complete len:236 (-) Transcript_44143:679-1386(-)
MTVHKSEKGITTKETNPKIGAKSSKQDANPRPKAVHQRVLLLPWLARSRIPKTTIPTAIQLGIQNPTATRANTQCLETMVSCAFVTHLVRDSKDSVAVFKGSWYFENASLAAAGTSSIGNVAFSTPRSLEVGICDETRSMDRVNLSHFAQQGHTPGLPVFLSRQAGFGLPLLRVAATPSSCLPGPSTGSKMQRFQFFVSRGSSLLRCSQDATPAGHPSTKASVRKVWAFIYAKDT